MTKIKNIFDELISLPVMAKKLISKVQDVSVECQKSKTHGEQRLKQNKAKKQNQISKHCKTTKKV